MSFSPLHPHRLAKLPPNGVNNNNYWPELLRARTLLAELKGLSLTLPNPFILISSAVIRESVASSQIENINTTIQEVLQSQLLPLEERRPVDKEVLRYREAVLWAFNKKNLPISNRIILGIHQRLVQQGGGQFRSQQNQIENILTHEVIYTPPIVPDLQDLMSNWEQIANTQIGNLDPLLKCAILHYQFEAIHPFSDGNGRAGRILMVVQLVKEKILPLPTLFISGYLDNHRSDYYRLLTDVTKENNWEDYLKFMLVAFAEQAQDTKDLLQGIRGLYFSTKRILKKCYQRIYSVELLDALFSSPIISPVRLSEIIRKHYTTASKYLQVLSKGGLLKESWAGKYHLYTNTQLLKVFTSKRSRKG